MAGACDAGEMEAAIIVFSHIRTTPNSGDFDPHGFALVGVREWSEDRRARLEEVL